jgi:hypothetical protein
VTGRIAAFAPIWRRRLEQRLSTMHRINGTCCQSMQRAMRKMDPLLLLVVGKSASLAEFPIEIPYRRFRQTRSLPLLESPAMRISSLMGSTEKIPAATEHDKAAAKALRARLQQRLTDAGPLRETGRTTCSGSARLCAAAKRAGCRILADFERGQLR